MKPSSRTILHLSLLLGIGPRIIENIVRGLSSVDELEKIYTCTIADFINHCGLSEKQARSVRDGLANTKVLDEECALLEKHDISIVTIADDEYPELLRHIHLPPSILYYKGTLPGKKTLAFVGARTAGEYADQVVSHLVSGLAHDGWTVVSGGAHGVDTMAHRRSLEYKVPTVVVLGSGLLQPYPFANKKLFDDVVKNNGCIVSSFSLNAGPQRGNFPARNRIIAGLSQGCVVVQAGQKSGALITAHCAVEEGRHIFAVPGPINDPLSVGCHHLLGQGAKLVQTVDDILEEFGSAGTHEHKPVFRSQQQSVSVKKTVLKQTGNPIIDVLDVPRSLDDISIRTGQTVADLQFKLFDLQIEGKVQQNFAGLWERV